MVVCEGVAVRVVDEVSVPVLERLELELGVAEGDLVTEPVRVPVLVLLVVGVCVGVVVILATTVVVEAVCETDEVGVGDVVILVLGIGVLDGVIEVVGVPVGLIATGVLAKHKKE